MSPFKVGDAVVYYKPSGSRPGIGTVISSGNVTTQVRWSNGAIENVWNERLKAAPTEPDAPIAAPVGG